MAATKLEVGRALDGLLTDGMTIAVAGSESAP
jgi:hypothetical protein